MGVWLADPEETQNLLLLEEIHRQLSSGRLLESDSLYSALILSILYILQ